MKWDVEMFRAHEGDKQGEKQVDRRERNERAQRLEGFPTGNSRSRCKARKEIKIEAAGSVEPCEPRKRGNRELALFEAEYHRIALRHSWLATG